jgi:hypothetical protein
MLEITEIRRHGQQYFLNEVVRVAVLNVVSSQPRANQRRVEIRQPIPIVVFSATAQALEKTKRGFMHLEMGPSERIVYYQQGRANSACFPQ